MKLADMSEYRANRRRKVHRVNVVKAFEDEVNLDINRLRESFPGMDMDVDGAIKLASDFYRKYPALIEYVRSVDNSLGR